MIARIAGRGHSFKGAGMYYLHDKEAQTAERVEWTQARNMPVNDNTAAINWMAYTAMNTEKLKQESGVPLTGRKREKGVVYTFSLSWSPEEKPDKVLMIKSADETLELLGLKDHQSLIVAHNDTKHPHVHVICNLINPNDGRMHDPDWGSKLKMSEWALKHEFENGKVYCQQREENIAKRREGKAVKYREPLHDRKAEIQEIYRQSENGAAFTAALEAKGYTLTTGNRRRFVLVDDEGKIHSLSRQLDKDQCKEHLQKLSDLDHVDLPLAQAVADERMYFDRDKQEREQLQRIEDAAIEKAKRDGEAEKQARAKPQEQKPDADEKKKMQGKSLQTEWNTRAGKEKDKLPIFAKRPLNDDKKHLVQLDKEQAWDAEAFSKRAALERKLEEVYEREKQVKTIEAYERQLQRYDTPWGRRLGKYKELSEEIKAQKLTLENIDMRIAEERSKLENEIAKVSPYKHKNQGGGQDLNPAIDFEKARKQREDKGKGRPSSDHDDDRTYNLDRS